MLLQIPTEVKNIFSSKLILDNFFIFIMEALQLKEGYVSYQTLLVNTCLKPLFLKYIF